jgi:hypothetical protein
MLGSKEGGTSRQADVWASTVRCDIILSLYAQAPQFSIVGCYGILQRGHWPDVVLDPGLPAAQCDNEECVQDERRQRRAMQVLFPSQLRGAGPGQLSDGTMPWMGRPGKYIIFVELSASCSIFIIHLGRIA